MHPERLLRLYPRPWRERYGAEFLATFEPGPLHPQQVIDVVAGAIDAWLSSEIRRATRTSRVAPEGGGLIVLKSIMACERRRARFTTRDSLIGAAVMLGAVLLLTLAGVAARRSGWSATGEVFTSLAFPASLILSMPFWLMKGQPWRAQVVIVGTTLALLVVTGWVATLI